MRQLYSKIFLQQLAPVTAAAIPVLAALPLRLALL